MSSNPQSGSLDVTLEVLSHSTRRYVLWYLGRDATDARVSTETLASAVAAWETDGEGADREGSDGDEAEVDSDARQRAHASLRHVHLPRLESAGLIERTSESESGASGLAAAEYVEATTEGTPVDAFFDAGLVETFDADDWP